MKNFSKKLLSIVFVCTTLTGIAQKDGRDFTEIDEYVKKLGSLDSMNMGTITKLVTKDCISKTEKVRAIFDWIALNIVYDIKTARNGGADKNTPTQVLLYRKATGAGYANLFQDMASSAGVRCLTVDGFVKFGAEQINDTKTEINHTWNVVQLGESPDAWYYVDACMGSGFPDAEFKTFTKAFNPDYFFADLTIFNWQHFPDNIAWYLGPRLKNKKDFFEIPVIKSAAYELGLKKMNPIDGAVKTTVNKAFPFSYQVSLAAEVTKVELVYGEGKKQKRKTVEFTLNNRLLGFTYKFEEEGTFPLKVVINGKELVEYMVDVE